MLLLKDPEAEVTVEAGMAMISRPLPPGNT